VNACDELGVPIEGANAALAEKVLEKVDLFVFLLTQGTKFENVSSVETALTPEMASELKKVCEPYKKKRSSRSSSFWTVVERCFDSNCVSTPKRVSVAGFCQICDGQP
jgi:hypothetical protein